MKKDTRQGDQTAPNKRLDSDPDNGPASPIQGDDDGTDMTPGPIGNSAGGTGGVIQTPGGVQLELSPEEQAEIDRAKEDQTKKKQALVADLVERLIEKREAIVRSRRSIEKRWIDDVRQWDGESRLMNTKEFPSQTNDDNMKPPRPHLTRSRCDLWESRMIDLIVPTDDATWDLNPLTQEDAQPPDGVDPDQWAAQIKAITDDADAKALAMSQVIKDQLAACNSQKALRKMCRDACRMGTGLVMGPMNGTHVRRRYNPAGAKDPDPSKRVTVTIEESIVPEIREGDPRYFFPDMTQSADKAEFAFYLHLMGETQLWEFAEFPGVDREEVFAVMDEKPEYGEIETSMREWNSYSGLHEDIANRHAVWRYTGIVDRKYLKALDLDVDDGMVSADIWFCNTHILKSKLTMLSAVKDFRIPYYVYSPFPLDDTMFGASVAYLCRDSQRTADAAWLIGLHNLSVSAGPQIIIRKGMITPADGKWSIRGPKVWYINANAGEGDVSNFFQSVQIENNSEQAFNCFEMAKSLMDEELNTTQWASPDTSEPAQSGIGWAMMSNARTILQRRVCATADDDVIGPMITRFVLWNLLYNEREDIKGDYDVQPLCQSVRMVKDIQNQQKLFIANNVATQPMFQSIFEPYDMVSDIIRGMDVPVENWLKPKQQWMQEQQQAAQSAQSNPQAQLAAANTHLALAKAQTESMKQSKMSSDANLAQQQQDQESGQAAAAPDPMELQKHAMDKQVELAKTNSDLAGVQAKAQSDETVAAMNLQAKNNQIAADLHKNNTRNATDLLKTGVQAHVKIATATPKFPVGPAAPKQPAAKFVAPKVPPIKRG